MALNPFANLGIRTPTIKAPTIKVPTIKVGPQLPTVFAPYTSKQQPAPTTVKAAPTKYAPLPPIQWGTNPPNAGLTLPPAFVMPAPQPVPVAKPAPKPAPQIQPAFDLNSYLRNVNAAQQAQISSIIKPMPAAPTMTRLTTPAPVKTTVKAPKTK